METTEDATVELVEGRDELTDEAIVDESSECALDEAPDTTFLSFFDPDPASSLSSSIWILLACNISSKYLRISSIDFSFLLSSVNCNEVGSGTFFAFSLIDWRARFNFPFCCSNFLVSLASFSEYFAI